MPNPVLVGITENSVDYDFRDMDAQEKLVSKANVDGSYSNMTVGNAEQLVSTVGITDKVPYVFRTSGGSADIGDREEDTVVGGTVAWNQLINKANLPATITTNGITFTNNDDGTISATGTATALATIFFSPNGSSTKNIPVINGHKYLLSGTPSGGSSSTYFMSWSLFGDDTGNGRISGATATETIYGYIRITEGTTVNLLFKPQLFDLTQMFGPTIADYLYTLETATPGAGVEWVKKFILKKPYYAYNPGSLESVQTSAHEMTGFNQWDEEWRNGYYGANGGYISGYDNVCSKNPIPVVGGQSYLVYVPYSDMTIRNGITFYDADMNFISLVTSNSTTPVVAPSDARYMNFYVHISYGSTYANNISVSLYWDGERAGEYEPYVKYSYPLDSSLTLRGIPKLDSGNNLYYDGDTYEADGTVTRRYGIVDLGTLTWDKLGDGTCYYTRAFDNIIALSPSVICSKYAYIGEKHGNAEILANTTIGLMTKYNTPTGNPINIYDPAYTDAATLKTALSGVYLVYELAEPTTEEAEPYQTPQIVDDFGTEEYVDIRDAAIPVGHETVYRNNLRAKLEMAPESPDGNGDYVVRQTNGVNEYVPLVIPAELPINPSEDGTYVLKATVSDGTTVLSWEVQA